MSRVQVPSVTPSRLNECARGSMDRASGFGPEGCGFESCRAHHPSLKLRVAGHLGSLAQWQSNRLLTGRFRVRIPGDPPRKAPWGHVVNHIESMYFVYLLQSDKDKSWYIGYTPADPVERLKKHNKGEVQSTKYKAPWKLIYYEAYTDQKDATGREKFLKSGSGRRLLKKQLKYSLRPAV
jgi:putative endonuclease